MSGFSTSSSSWSTPFDSEPDRPNGFTSENVQDAIEEAKATAPGLLARFTISLLHNGTVGNNTFFGYNELINGSATPVILPIKCIFSEFTFSNNKANADYTLEFRRNITTGPPFLSVSKVNTKFFFEDGISQQFNAGDSIYVRYRDNGDNASDAAVVLYFKAN